jgi:hypothetical protein
MEMYLHGTVRNFEKFFKKEGFTKSKALYLVSKLKTEGFQARDERKTLLMATGPYKNSKFQRMMVFLTELAQKKRGNDPDLRDEAESKKNPHWRQQ